MEKVSVGRVLFRTSVRTISAISLAGLLVAPGWAQRGQERGSGPPPPPMHMSPPPMMPQMPRAMPMPRPAPMPQPAPMPRSEPMPRPEPMPRTAPMPPRQPAARERPVRSAPPVRAQGNPTTARGTADGETKAAGSTDSGSSLPRSLPTGSTLSSPSYVRSTTDSRVKPAFTRSTPEDIRNRARYIKTLVNQPVTPVTTVYGNGYGYGYNYPYGWGYGAFGFGFDPFFSGGLFCDPFGVWACFGPAGYGMYGNGFYLFPSLMFLSAFGYSPFGLSYYPGSWGAGYYGMYSGYGCTFCDPSLMNALAINYDGGDAGLTPLQTSVLISNGVMPGLESVSTATERPSDLSGDTSPAAASDTGYLGAGANAESSSISPGTAKLPNGQPIELIFTSGASVQAIQYWVSNDGRLTYVTSDGVKHVVPLSDLDFVATAKANQQAGVEFLPPTTEPPSPSESH